MRKWLAIWLVACLGSLVYGNDGTHFSTYMGGSVSFPSHLDIPLVDLPGQSFQANWNDLPFSDSHWWAGRIENWQGNAASGIELIHHKIYLGNTNDIIKSFSISDGFNLLYYNMGWKTSDIDRFRVGLGMVWGHSDTIIGDRPRFHTPGLGGMYATGPTIQFDYEHYLWQNDSHFISFDTKLSASYAKVPVSPDRAEYAETTDLALHFSIGFGSKPVPSDGNLLRTLDYLLPGIYPATVGGLLMGTGMSP